MDCTNLNFLALPNEVRKHAENALKSFSGNGMPVFNQNIFDAIGKLREENRLFEIRLDEQENDIYVPVDEDYWFKLLNNDYIPGFAHGYKEAKETILSLKDDKEQQHFIVFSGVYRIDEKFTVPISELDGHQVVLESKMNSFGYQTGRFIGFWDFIFLNPQPFESLFLQKSESSVIAKGLQFHGTKMDFVELMVALKENGNLKATYTEIFEVCGKFFGVEIKYRDKYILDLKNNRNAGREVKLLNQLITALNNHVHKKIIR